MEVERHPVYKYTQGEDIVSTSGEIPEKFIRELHSVANYVKILEMPPKQLGISTVIPGMGRTLKQYTIDDIKKQLKYVSEMQDDKKAFMNVRGKEKIRLEDIM